MSIKIEPGKKYTDRVGDVWQFFRPSDNESKYQCVMKRCSDGFVSGFMEDGRFYSNGQIDDCDLLAEWTDLGAPPTEKPETLRDRFAMYALMGILSRVDGFAEEVAKEALIYADAMMEAREK